MSDDDKYLDTPDESNLPVTAPVDAPLSARTWDLRNLAMTAGTLELSTKQKEILYAPVDEATIQIRPDDGIPYVPHVEVRRRFDEAFAGKWALVPLGMPVKEGATWIANYILIVNGCFVAQAEGSMKDTNNKKMDRTDYGEGAKSNALTRCAKGWGLFPELWDVDWREDWKARWSYQGTKDGRQVWLKRKPDEVVPIEPAQFIGLVELTMELKGVTAGEAVAQLESYWLKAFKTGVLRGRKMDADKMLEKLSAQKESALSNETKVSNE